MSWQFCFNAENAEKSILSPNRTNPDFKLTYS